MIIDILFLAFVAGVVLFLVLISVHVDNRIDKLEDALTMLRVEIRQLKETIGAHDEPSDQ